ncbi:MAG: hypothetical protein H6Q69_173 [Firmicutes bacterium]|nr:hypothetical protein [Bacillota bacterium]
MSAEKGRLEKKLVSILVNAAEKPKKILLVYENMGAGHLRMARILQDILAGDKAELVVVDGEGMSGSTTPDFCVKAWNWLLKKNWLRFQNIFMNYLLRMLFVPIVEAVNNTATMERIAAIAPDVVICVCDGYSRVLGEYAREKSIPFFLVITDIAVCFDLVNTNAVHVCYFPETAAAVQSYPLDAGYYAKNLSRSSSWKRKVGYVFEFYYDFIWRRRNMFYRSRETEFAVQNNLPCEVIGPLAEKKFFTRLDKRQLQKKYRLPPDIVTVAIASGGQGGQYLRNIVEVLGSNYHHPLNLLVMCGYDTETLEVLKARSFGQINVIPVSHTDCFHEYLGMADCAIIRPSAGTFVECLLQRTPVIVPYLTLANDRGSLLIVERYRIGEFYDRISDIPAVLETVLANQNYYDVNLEQFMNQYPGCYELHRANLRRLILGKEGKA